MSRKSDLSDRTPNECACNDCAAMCKRSPCLGSPDDILKLINNGFINHISQIGWAVGTRFGLPIIEMFQIGKLPDGSCPLFLRESGLCSIHDLGLKPIEGKLAHHKTFHIRDQATLKQSLSYQVASTWLDPIYNKTIRLIIKAMDTYENTQMDCTIVQKTIHL